MINRFISAHGNKNGLSYAQKTRKLSDICKCAVCYCIEIGIPLNLLFLSFCIAQAASQAAATAQVCFLHDHHGNSPNHAQFAIIAQIHI